MKFLLFFTENVPYLAIFMLGTVNCGRIHIMDGWSNTEGCCKVNSPNNNLLIVGAGQYGFVAREIALAMGGFGEIAFLDDSNRSDGISVIGSTSDVEKFASSYRYGFVAIGNPEVRRAFVEKLRFCGIEPTTLVHPTAYVSPSAKLDKGCCVEPLAVVQTGATVATASFIASGAVVRHNAIVGEFCHIDCNAVVETTAIVPTATKVACNSVFRKGQNS